MVDLPLPDCPTSARTLPGSMLRLKSLQEQPDHRCHFCLKCCGASLEPLQPCTSGAFAAEAAEAHHRHLHI